MSDSPVIVAGSQLGKRYECAVCGTIVLCLRPGPGPFACCDRPMVEKEMQELPSGD